MTEKKRPKVIILESDLMVCDHVESILSKEGWDVTCEHVSKNALDRLAQPNKRVFALFISNFKLPKMEGDDILQKVKALSPFTQRMLMVPADKPETLISAINKAEINACITSVFKDKELTGQAKKCFKQFKHALKKQQLKRVTGHQNRQMLKIAQKLKKKDDTYTHLIDEKKSHLLMLKSIKRKTENKKNLSTDISLSHLIDHKEIVPAPDAFNREFSTISRIIKGLFDKVLTRNKLDPISFKLEEILNEKKSECDGPPINVDTLQQPEKDQTDSKASSDGEQTSKQALPDKESSSSMLMGKIIKQAYTLATNLKSPEGIETEDEDTCTGESGDIIDKYFKISISETQVEAYIKRIKSFDDSGPTPDLSDLLEALRLKQISYGILDDEAIETWISKSRVEKIMIANGESPVLGQDGEIKYHFETDFTNPGKISEDGSIDFRDRGDIPFVKKETLLAEKTLPKQGSPGISISGTPIPVEEVFDPVFTAGPGTKLSEDELKIYAAIDGQPHLDSLGSISVNPELVIPGDVDYETGNIDFKGNIIVKGMVKEGFTVKGINLTAKEIEGATIELSGDLNISAGITNATISAPGHIYAKFINDSHIMGFGNLVISKEIIDSDIMISGSCQNQTGHIISSMISAKMGIEASKIGTPSSKPVKLKVGIDEHVETLKKQVNEALEISVDKLNHLKNEIKTLEDQDQELYQQISEKAHIQDRSQIDIKALKQSVKEFEKTNDTAKIQQASNGIKKLFKKAKEAEQELNAIFKTQDSIANKTIQLKDQIKRIEENNKALVLEKKALKEFSKKDPPSAIVTVANTITQNSIIKGPHASLILREDTSRCRIQEIVIDEEGLRLHEMKISDL